jgi:ankyrin repeat protein
MKASVHSKTHNLEWTPIFCAVCFSNLETLQELWLLHCSPNLPQLTDLRGWNLLHVAVGAGNFDAVPFLLEKGVDPNAKSRGTSRFIPPALADKSVTPVDVAINCGIQAYQKWAEALAATDRGKEVQLEYIIWEDMDIDGLYGGCECCQKWGF